MIAPKILANGLLDCQEGQLLTGKIGRQRVTQASVTLGTSFAASLSLADALDDARANQDARVADLPAELDAIV